MLIISKHYITFIVFLMALVFTSCSHRGVNKESEQLYWNTISAIADDAEAFAQEHKLSEKYCLLVDYGLPSGTPRVYVWSFEEKKILFKAHTMHGCGGGSTDAEPVFSNKLGSNCSTLGNFAITRHHGTINRTGYRLKGLDSENANAWDRALMIHNSSWVDHYCHKKYIPLSEVICQGCVTVNVKAMEKIGRLVEGEKRKILLRSFVVNKDIKTY